MAVPNSEAVQWLPSGSTSAESRSGRIGPIILEAKQTGERSARNPHAAFDEAGAGNVAWPDPRALAGRVGDWRAGLGRSLCSLLARSFVCECHTISAVPRFQPPPRRTHMGSSGGIFLALHSAFIALAQADAGGCDARLF